MKNDMILFLIVLAVILVARAVYGDIKRDRADERDIERRLDEANADAEAARVKNAEAALRLHIAKRANERTNLKEREHARNR